MKELENKVSSETPGLLDSGSESVGTLSERRRRPIPEILTPHNLRRLDQDQAIAPNTDPARFYQTRLGCVPQSFQSDGPSGPRSVRRR